MSFLTDMRDRLTAQSFSAATVALARLPDQPDVVLALLEIAPGPSVDLDADSLPAHERFALQVVARVGSSSGVAAAEAIAWSAYRLLAGRHVTIGSEVYDWIRPDRVPTLIGFDELDRPVVTTTFSAQRHGDLS